MTRQLDEIDARLERIVSNTIEAQLFFRIARPLLAIAGWRASVESSALTSLVAMVRTKEFEDVDAAKKTFDAAVKELQQNTEAVERVAIVKKRAPIAHALWLRRVHAMLVLVETAIAAADAKRVASIDPSTLLPPLAPVAKKKKKKSDDEDAKEDSEEPSSSTTIGEDHPEIEDARLVDLELAAIDHLMAAARAETLVLGRKRRLFIAARQRLLEASAALPLDHHGVRERTRYLAREITRIDRLEGAGLSTDVSLLHQARQALSRKDAKRLYASVSALDANARSADDVEVSSRTATALKKINKTEKNKHRGRSSLMQSATDLLGDVATQVSVAVDEAREDAERQAKSASTLEDRNKAREFLQYLSPNAGSEILHATVAADGFFEVGGALLPVRVVEEERVVRMVRHPTQDLVLMPAEDVHDLRDAIIGDPRSVLLDLATGRLSARRFVREEVRHKSRVTLRAEVRVYVLDGSGSMKGPRARVRDAILIAEISTLMRRLSSPTDTRCTLFFRYFNETLGPITRVGSLAAANEAIRDVVTTERAGGTDIQAALVASLEQVAESRATDPNLVRAQIVIVTDGESAVDEPTIAAARESMAGLPIGVSVIALGQENDALRGLVARQRAKGEATFYHFIDDAELKAITEADGATDAIMCIHPPDRWSTLAANPAKLAQALEDEVGGLLDELEELDRSRDVGAFERHAEEVQARREVGLPEDEEGDGDGERARFEALRKDRVSLAARYARWFPAPATATTLTENVELPNVGTAERDDIDAVCCALASVAEVVVLLGGSQSARQADAIDLLERLLPDARLTRGRYRAVLRDHGGAVAPSMQALRDAVGSVASDATSVGRS